MIITSRPDLQACRTRCREAATRAVSALSELLESHADRPDVVLRTLKFDKIGWDPLNLERRDNFCEQVDQQATVIAALDATEWLMERHPGKRWRVEPAATGTGNDIVSDDGDVVAEVFAAVDPRNNRKLKKDLAKARAAAGARHRYVIYRSPIAAVQPFEDVVVHRLPD